MRQQPKQPSGKTFPLDVLNTNSFNKKTNALQKEENRKKENELRRQQEAVEIENSRLPLVPFMIFVDSYFNGDTSLGLLTQPLITLALYGAAVTTTALLSFKAGAVFLAISAAGFILNELFTGLQDIYDGTKLSDDIMRARGGFRILGSFMAITIGTLLAIISLSIAKYFLISSGPVGWAVLLASVAIGTILVSSIVKCAERKTIRNLRCEAVEKCKSTASSEDFLDLQQKLKKVNTSPLLMFFGSKEQEKARSDAHAFNKALKKCQPKVT